MSVRQGSLPRRLAPAETWEAAIALQFLSRRPQGDGYRIVPSVHTSGFASRLRGDKQKLPTMNAREGKRNPEVDAYLRKATNWQQEMAKLRGISLGCGLTEELKWGKPCYTFQGSNVVIIQGFKESCALLFAKGALLKDPHHLLEKPGENTQAARRIPFTNVGEIKESILKAYIEEAVEVEKSGRDVEYKKISEFTIPEELQKRFDKNRALKTAFQALTPGRQRGYLLYFSSAKHSKTREARVEKCMPRILKGKGLNDE